MNGRRICRYCGKEIVSFNGHVYHVNMQTNESVWLNDQNTFINDKTDRLDICRKPVI